MRRIDTYLCETDPSATPHLRSQEHSQFAWVGVSELPAIPTMSEEIREVARLGLEGSPRWDRRHPF